MHRSRRFKSLRQSSYTGVTHELAVERKIMWCLLCVNPSKLDCLGGLVAPASVNFRMWQSVGTLTALNILVFETSLINQSILVYWSSGHRIMQISRKELSEELRLTAAVLPGFMTSCYESLNMSVFVLLFVLCFLTVTSVPTCLSKSSFYAWANFNFKFSFIFCDMLCCHLKGACNHI